MKMSDTTEIKFNDWAITRSSYFGKLSEYEGIDGLYLALTLNGQIVDWVRLETVIEEYLKSLQNSNEPQWVRIALKNRTLEKQGNSHIPTVKGFFCS